MRLYLAGLAAGELTIRGDEHHYLSHVRRSRVGDAVELFDGAGQRAAATIVGITDGETIVRVEQVEREAEGPTVRVLLPLIKGDRMDVCLEKLVEVGIDEIVLWPAARAVVRLEGARLASRLTHYQAALQAAARQSGRARIPTIRAAASLAAAIADPVGTPLVLDPAADRVAAPTGDATLISGPEGGLAPSERELLSEFTPFGLGPRTLRAETAPVVAVALLRAATRS